MMNDFVIKSKHILWFPCQLGLTGKAFQEDFLCFNNLVDKKTSGSEGIMTEKYFKEKKLRVAQHEFMRDIDNSLGAKQFDNYIIGAIYDPFNKPNGLLQIFNFKD